MYTINTTVEEPEIERGAQLGLPPFKKIQEMFDKCERIAPGSKITIRHPISEKYGPPLDPAGPALKSMLQLYTAHKAQLQELLGAMEEPLQAELELKATPAHNTKTQQQHRRHSKKGSATNRSARSTNTTSGERSKGSKTGQTKNPQSNEIVPKQKSRPHSNPKADPKQKIQSNSKPKESVTKPKPQSTTQPKVPAPKQSPQSPTNATNQDEQVRKLLLSNSTTTSYEELNKLLSPQTDQQSPPPIRHTPATPPADVNSPSRRTPEPGRAELSKSPPQNPAKVSYGSGGGKQPQKPSHKSNSKESNSTDENDILYLAQCYMSCLV